MMLCVIVLFITGIAIFFISALQYPGVAIVADTLLPLNRGYERFFHLNAPAGTWFALPSVFATGFGFMFIYGRQMNSMSRSGLFPQIFKLRTNGSKTPYVSLLFGTGIAIVGVILLDLHAREYLEHVFAVCILAAYTIYIAAFVSYCIFKFRYSGVPRHFTNPLNIYSALYGIGVFALGLISIVGFQENMGPIPLIIFLIYLTCLIVYYMFYGFRTQQLSEEEQKVMFRAYVINGEI
jgi:L-asparagine transporter-like permease